MNENYQPDTCGYCRKRGSACAKHGGQPTAYQKKQPHKVYTPVPSQKDHQPAPDHFPEGFANPYGCSMCARKGALCEMHMQLDRDRRAKTTTTPPPAAPAGPPPVKATQQKVDGHRIVKITAGNVIITIQEPL